MPTRQPSTAHVIGRRAFLAGVVASTVAAGCSSDDSPEAADEAPLETGSDMPPVPPSLPADPFRLGVASGDPRSDAVILWTRLLNDPLAADGGGIPDQPIPVQWEVATSERFDDVVASGEVVAEPAWGHAVHVDAAGLEPDTWYHYRFSVGPATSPVGRTRTTPTSGADVDRLRFAFASCQNYQQGYWPAHTHLAAEDDLDLVVFLGDYVYGEPPDARGPRSLDGEAPTDLAGYRRRYAEYKSDPALQAAHAAAPWVCTWDDNEVQGNYAGAVAGVPGADDDDFVDRRAAAYQAWYEHTPVRVVPPAGPDMAIHRTVSWGELARFIVLDGRQYRSDQACDVPQDIGIACDEVDDDERTMLGDDQESWLDRRLEDSDATWNVVAQQTVVSRMAIPAGAAEGVNLDQWDGYPAARLRLVDQLSTVDNPVVITGDIHAGAVGLITADPDDPDTSVVAPELVCPSVSSLFPPAFVPAFEQLARTMPSIRYVEPNRRGYVVCDVTADRLAAEFRYVADTTSPDSPLGPGRRWVISADDPEPRPG